MTMTLGQRIAALRKARGWTQYELSAEVGVVARTISCWERGVTPPGGEYIDLLAEALDIDPAVLLSPHDSECPCLSCHRMRRAIGHVPLIELERRRKEVAP